MSETTPRLAALFIDYEHVVFGSLNQGRRVPTPDELMALAAAQGKVIVAKAFASSFSEEPLQKYGDYLITAGIEQVNCAFETRPDGSTKSYTDFQIVNAIYQSTHTNPGLQVYVIVTGDGHFTPVVAFLRRFLEKEVLVAGLSDQTHHKLQEAASHVTLIDPPQLVSLSDGQVRELIRFVSVGERENKRVTLASTARVFKIPGIDEGSMRGAILDLIERGVFEQREDTGADGRTLRRMYLIRENPLVCEVLADASSASK